MIYINLCLFAFFTAQLYSMETHIIDFPENYYENFYIEETDINSYFPQQQISDLTMIENIKSCLHNDNDVDAEKWLLRLKALWNIDFPFMSTDENIDFTKTFDQLAEIIIPNCRNTPEDYKRHLQLSKSANDWLEQEIERDNCVGTEWCKRYGATHLSQKKLDTVTLKNMRLESAREISNMYDNTKVI